VKPTKERIDREIRALRKVIDNDKDPLVTRVAYLVETSLRWAIEDTVDWPDRVQDVRDTAALIRSESKGPR
jgi:hypothetical protein